MEKITTFNGNGRAITKDLPKLVLIGHMNDVALGHIAENTDLYFEHKGWCYEAQPVQSSQIAALLLTYNFKTRYYDNATFKNQLHLKGDHHVGFDVNSICYDCVKENRINTNGLDADSRLAC